MAAIELDAKYTITGPRGDVAVFNDPTDPNYVGMLREVTGFDSPDVRESGDDLVQFDGGVHGDFFYGRRPITLTGTLLSPSSKTQRNQWQDKLTAATDAMRADSVIDWTPSGGSRRYMRVRRQQALRITGAWQKEFQIALVAADPRIYSYTTNTSTVAAAGSGAAAGRSYPKVYSFSYGPVSPNGQLLVANSGTTVTYPVLTITGPGTNPLISNITTGEQIALIYTLGAAETLVIDTLNRTVKLGGTADRYGSVDFLNTSWWGLDPGVNDIRVAFSSFSSPASLKVDWQDAWL